MQTLSASFILRGDVESHFVVFSMRNDLYMEDHSLQKYG